MPEIIKFKHHFILVMNPPKPLLATMVLLSFCLSANAQMSRYINDSPENEKRAEQRTEREASSVKEVPITVYGDSLSYTLLTYNLRSFDGKMYSVTASQKPFTKRINISCGNDSLVFVDVMGLDSVHFLNENLLEILYSPRGGSDLGLQNTVVLGIVGGKLHIALEIESDIESTAPGKWSEYYVTTAFAGQSENTYQLLIKTNNRYYPKSHSPKNHSLNARFTMRFDTKKKIFFNTYKAVNAIVGDLDLPIKKHRVKIVKGTYPAIKLGAYEYYYIGDSWYTAVKWFDGKIHLRSDT